MVSVKPSAHPFFFALYIALVKLPLAFCAGFINTPVGEVVVYANDPRIVYNPPFDITSGTWDVQLVPGIERNASQTTDPDARVSLVFRGSSLKLHALQIPGVSTPSLLDVKIDGTLTPAVQVDSGENFDVISLDESKVDSSVNHTVVVQKKEDSNSDSSWNFIAFGFTDPSPTPLGSLPPIAMISQLPGVSMAAGVSASPEVGSNSVTLSGGAIAGIVVSIICGIGVAGGLILNHRRRKDLSAPEPLIMISSMSTRPSSVIRTSTLDQRAPPNANDSFSFSTSEIRAGELQESERPRLSFSSTSWSSNGSAFGSTEVDGDIRPSSKRRSSEPISLGPPIPPSQVLRKAPPSYYSQDDPFQDEVASQISISMNSVTQLSRDLTLSSINPPPSYHTTA